MIDGKNGVDVLEFRILLFIWEFILDVLELVSMSAHEKDIQILLLQQQLRIAERQQKRAPSLTRWEKIPLAALAQKLKETSDNAKELLEATSRIFKPATLIKWHRQLARRKWTFDNTPKMGRPPLSPEVEQWIVTIARENPSFGYDKIEGEIRKLGFQVSATTIRTILLRHGILPAPQRDNSSWQTFLNHYKQQFLATDFFTVETLWLQTIYVLFFIEHGTRRVHFAGCTSNPNNAWITQQARQTTWLFEDDDLPMRFLIHDHDTKFSRSFDTVFEASDIEIIYPPFQAPNANAFAERWVRTVREECLDKIIILNEAHLRRVLKQYLRYYNSRRPHQGIQQDCPDTFDAPDLSQPIRCHHILGGIIKDYHRSAA